MMLILVLVLASPVLVLVLVLVGLVLVLVQVHSLFTSQADRVPKFQNSKTYRTTACSHARLL